MPTYDYECSSCGHRFEVFEKIDASPRKKCPRCRKGNSRRLMGTGAGFLFKGSGFYTTDSRKNGSGAPAAKETKPAEPSKKKTVRKEKKGD